MEKRDKRLDNLTLEDLFRYTRSMRIQEFNAAIHAAFPGEESVAIRNRFLDGSRVDFAREARNNQSLINVLGASIDVDRCDVRKENSEILKLENEVADLELELKEIQRRLGKARHNLEAARRRKGEALEDIAKQEESLKKAVEEGKKIGIILLVHRSATLEQLMEYPKGAYFVSSEDSEFVAEGIYDSVYYVKENLDYVPTVPFSAKLLAPEVLVEYIAYVKMVMDFASKGVDFVALYSAPEIADLIRVNIG